MTTTDQPSWTPEEENVLKLAGREPGSLGRAVVDLIRVQGETLMQMRDEHNANCAAAQVSDGLSPKQREEVEAILQEQANNLRSAAEQHNRAVDAANRGDDSAAREALEKADQALGLANKHERTLYGEDGQPGVVDRVTKLEQRVTELEQNQPVASSSPVYRNERRFNRPVAVRVACIIGVLAMVAGFLVSFFTNQGVVQALFVGAAAGIAAALATLFVVVLINTFTRPTNAPA